MIVASSCGHGLLLRAMGLGPRPLGASLLPSRPGTLASSRFLQDFGLTTGSIIMGDTSMDSNAFDASVPLKVALALVNIIRVNDHKDGVLAKTKHLEVNPSLQGSAPVSLDTHFLDFKGTYSTPFWTWVVFQGCSEKGLHFDI